MKIAIISDIHGNIHGLKTVLSDLPKVDKIICAGDITGYYPFINEVIDELKKNNVLSVRGNHDQYLIQGSAPQNVSPTVKASVDFTKKIISQIMEFNSLVWKTKKDKGISLKEKISKIEIPKELKSFEKDLIACHNLE